MVSRKNKRFFKNTLTTYNWTHFSSWQEIKNIATQSKCFIEYLNIISEIITEFYLRFKNFDELKLKFLII